MSSSFPHNEIMVVMNLLSELHNFTFLVHAFFTQFIKCDFVWLIYLFL